MTSWSKSTFLAPGSLTSGDIDAVLGVGPIAPATNLGFSGVLNFFAASFAILGSLAQAGVATMIFMIGIMLLSILVTGTRGTFNF